MKIFQNYNFTVKGKLISKEEFRSLPFLKKEAIVASKAEAIVKRANIDLESQIPPLTLSQYRSYNTIGSTREYGAPYRERMNMALRLAFAKIITGEDKYFDKMLDVVWAMLDESTWMLPEHTVHMPEEATVRMSVPAQAGEKYAHGIELGSAYRSAVIALIYHFFEEDFDKISPFINERILYTLKQRCIEPFSKYYFWWEGMSGNRVNNWCPWIVSNVLLSTALTEDDPDVRELVAERSMIFLDNFINCYKPDGGCEEGPTYWNAAAACLFDSLELLEYLSAGLIDVYSEPLIRAMGEYLPRMNITDQYFVNFADSHARASQDGNMLQRFGEKCSSKILTSFSETMLKYESATFDVAVPYRTLRSFTSPERELGNVKPIAATDTYFPDLKVMVLRESETPNEGIFLAMKGGNNDESHNHNDVGSFIVYSDGKPVLIDAGVGEYTKQTFSKDRYKIWSMQSLYHNLPAFDGIGQPNGSKYASKDEVYDEKNRCLTLELADAYSAEAGVISYKRTGSLCGNRAVIRDVYKLSQSRCADFIFVTHAKPRILESGLIALPEDCVLEFDSALFAEIEEFDPVGMNSQQAWGSDKLFRIHLKVTGKEGDFTFRIYKS